MKQLSFLESSSSSGAQKSDSGVPWKLFIDGASRKNPGQAGAGVYLLKNNIVVFNKGFYLGLKTNNQAEYLALLLGIFYAKKYIHAHDILYIFSDSELLVKHMTGEYKIRNADLKHLFTLALHLIDDVRYSFCHVLRDYNTHADALANDGIDKKSRVPQEFLTMLHTHGIKI